MQPDAITISIFSVLLIVQVINSAAKTFYMSAGTVSGHYFQLSVVQEYILRANLCSNN